MKKQLAASFRSLRPKERASLILIALARDNLDDATALFDSVAYRYPEAHQTFEALLPLHFLGSQFIKDQLFLAVGALLILARNETVDPNGDQVRLLSSAFLSHLAGWRIFCDKRGIPEQAKFLALTPGYGNTFDVLERLFQAFADSSPTSPAESSQDLSAADFSADGVKLPDKALTSAEYAQLLEKDYASFFTCPPMDDGLEDDEYEEVT